MTIFGMRPATVLGAMLFASSLAQAATVQYTTSGLFDGVSNVKTIGSVTLTFQGATGPVDAEPWTFASLGRIVTTGSATLENLAGTSLVITINQTQPLPGGSDTFTAILSGSISGSSSSAIVDFGSIQIVTIGAAEYQNTQVVYQLVPQTAGGQTTLQGRIDVVPEPGTTMLMATGLGLVALAGRKYRRG